MEPQLVQNIRYKLQKRISRLNYVDSIESFVFTLAQFWKYFDQQDILVGIKDSLLPQFPEIENDINQIFQNKQGQYGETEEEAAAIGYCALRRLIDLKDIRQVLLIADQYGRSTDSHEALECIREIFLEPFYEYVDEQLDDQRAMLALLIRYKHRSEWFKRDYLWKLSQTERRGEKELALNLYSYLFDQGIDFIIEPSSISGEIDLIASQNTDDPLLLDTKIFDGDGRGKAYIRKGFNQIYTYTQQYNEPFGYLLIYKISERDLRFSLRMSSNIPMVIHNHKTIFLITIDLYPHDKPVSQREPIKATEITEEELVEIIDKDQN